MNMEKIFLFVKLNYQQMADIWRNGGLVIISLLVTKK
jgi:hypothetical protein